MNRRGTAQSVLHMWFSSFFPKISQNCNCKRRNRMFFGDGNNLLCWYTWNIFYFSKIPLWFWIVWKWWYLSLFFYWGVTYFNVLFSGITVKFKECVSSVPILKFFQVQSKQFATFKIITVLCSQLQALHDMCQKSAMPWKLTKNNYIEFLFCL